MSAQWEVFWIDKLFRYREYMTFRTRKEAREFCQKNEGFGYRNRLVW